MSDPKPGETAQHEQRPDGAADNSGGVEADEVNPEVPWVDPDAD